MQLVISVVAAAVFAIAVPGRLWAQNAAPEQSTDLAVALGNLLSQQGLDAIAAPDPAAPDRFVAALAFPNTQLLVVEAKYPVPALVQQQIADKKYRDVYMALQQSGIPDGKLFFLDLGFDGLRGGAEAVDVLYEGANKETVFDGSPAKHKLSKAAYEKQLDTAEAAYAHVLSVLIDQLKETATQ